MSLTEKKWQEGGLSNNLKCKLVWSGKQELIGNAEKQNIELRRKKKEQYMVVAITKRQSNYAPRYTKKEKRT